MSCNYCGKIHLNKTCPSGYTTTTTTEDPVLCPPKPLCDELFNSHCIYYSGSDIECAGISFGDNVNTIINNFISQLQDCCLPTTTTTTTTIDCNNPGGGGTPVFTTTTTCEPIFLICCCSYNTQQLQIIKVPCSLQGFTFKRWEIYVDITAGNNVDPIYWVVSNYNDIVSLGYTGANVSYVPNWSQLLWASDGQSTLIDTLSTCSNRFTQLQLCRCPEQLVPTTTTTSSSTTTSSTTTSTTLQPTTTTTTTILCQQYYLSNPSANPLTYGYVSCEGALVNGLSLPSKTCITIFAQAGSVVITPGIIIGFGECTTTTTSTTTTSTSTTTTTTTIEPSQLCFTILTTPPNTTTSTTSTSTTSTTSTTTTQLPIVGGVEIFAEGGDGIDLQVTAVLDSGAVGNDLVFSGFVQRYSDSSCTVPLGSPLPFGFTMFTAMTNATQTGVGVTTGTASLKIISLIVGATSVTSNPFVVDISGNNYEIYGYNQCGGL